MTEKKIALAEEFFRATATADRSLLNKVCDQKFTGKQNDGQPMTIQQLADYSALVLRKVKDFRYENIVRVATDTGFVEEHDVCCSLNHESSIRVRVCVVANIANDRIISVREYVDSRAARDLITAIS